MNGNAGHFDARNGNLYEAAGDYIRRCVQYHANFKDITLTPHEIDTCTEQVADELPDTILYGVACDRIEARSLATALSLDRLRAFYARKLAARVSNLPQSPIVTQIAILHHIRQAESKPPHTWPTAKEPDISDIASGDIGPLVWTLSDGVVTTTYYRGVRLHRHEADGPALVAVDGHGHVTAEEYWRNGRLHRTSGPAKIITNPATGTIQQTWLCDGRITRADAPAYIEQTLDGRILAEMWFTDDRLHRVGAPAATWHSIDGSWKLERFCCDGINGALLENGIEVHHD